MKLLYIRYYLCSLGSSHKTAYIREKTANWKKKKKLFLKFFLWFSHSFHNAVSVTSRKECNQWSKQKAAYSTTVHLSYKTYSTATPSFGLFQSHFAIFFGTIYNTLSLCLQCIIRSFNNSLWHSFGCIWIN